MAGIYIKRYRMKLETIGPLFIGAGYTLHKKEWALDRKKKIGILFDERKLFSYLNQKGLLHSFEDFLLKENKRMIQWLSETHIYPGDISQIEQYRVDCSGIAHANTDKGVQMFIKDGYGKPYVPGSSVKGALRNVILAKKFRENPCNIGGIVKQSKSPERKRPDKFLSQESRELNQRYFHTKNLPDTKPKDMVNDVMSGIRVSDSSPLGFDRLTMCQKVDVHVEGEERDMPLVRECIKPGTEISMELSIDTKQTEFTIEFIEQAICEFLQNYNREFLSKFEDEVLYEEDVLYLGGGVGYHSKTVTGNLLEGEKNRVEITGNIINSTLPRQKQNEHKHFKDKTLGVSPHIVKLTEYDGALCQFGPCRIQFEPF